MNFAIIFLSVAATYGFGYWAGRSDRAWWRKRNPPLPENEVRAELERVQNENAHLRFDHSNCNSNIAAWRSRVIALEINLETLKRSKETGHRVLVPLSGPDRFRGFDD